jgi:hypothetical protein
VLCPPPTARCRRFADANQLYARSEEERLKDEQLVRTSQLIALGVVLAPVLLVAAATLAGKQ